MGIIDRVLDIFDFPKKIARRIDKSLFRVRDFVYGLVPSGVKRIAGMLNKILDIPYRIAFFPIHLICIPLRWVRRSIDVVLFYVRRIVAPFTYFNNLSGGFIYNVLNTTILLPSLIGVDVYFFLFPGERKKYSWMDICFGSRIMLWFTKLYKAITKPMLLIPIVGWLFWIIMLPLGYFLALYEAFIVICPIEEIMPFLAPSAFRVKAGECNKCKCALPL
jgi:hypothetical protein